MNQVRLIQVLHIASGDLWAGAEVQLYTLVKSLQPKPDVKITTVVLNHGKLEQQLCKIGCQVIVFDETTLNSFQILIRLVHTIRAIKPDIIHTHRIKENILGSLAARLTGNIPSVRTAHGAPEHRPAWHQVPKHLILFLDRLCGSFLQKGIVAVSEDLAAILSQEFSPTKIRVIENGIDLDTLNRVSTHSAASLKTSNTPLKVGMAGRLVPVKRVDLFIETARIFLDQHPDLDVSFHIYGDGPLREELETLNRQLSTNDIVHFEGHREDILNELQKLDILLMASDHEGLPMILLEAMALQIPIIAHNVGGIPHLLNHGSCGILVQEQNPSTYAYALYQLVTNPKTRLKLAKQALRRVSISYSAEQNADAYRTVYNQLLS